MTFKKATKKAQAARRLREADERASSTVSSVTAEAAHRHGFMGGFNFG